MAIATRDARLDQLRDDLAALFPESAAHFERARAVIPSGCSRSRFAFPFAIVIDRAQGSRLWDIDGREYVDALGAFGPMLLGFGHPEVVAAISAQLEKGFMFGSATKDEAALAERIVEHVPGAEKVVMLTSGTEATLAAIRLARAKTGRDKIAKFTGGWHGSHDAVLQTIWTRRGEPDSLESVAEGDGIPAFFSNYTVALPWNDPAAFDRIRREADDLACVIIELVQGAGGALPVDREFLGELEDVCRANGVLLIADEVLTGFRVGLSGAAGHFGITPDLVALGKVVAGGLPGSAVTGRADIIVQNSELMRDQTVLMAGTNSGHPMSMAAGRATLDVLSRDRDVIYPRLFELGERLRSGLQDAFDESGFGRVTGVGPLFGVHPTFQEPSPEGAQAAAAAATALSGLLIREGVFVSSPAHLGFLSAAHTAEDVDVIVAAHETALVEMKDRGFF